MNTEIIVVLYSDDSEGESAQSESPSPNAVAGPSTLKRKQEVIVISDSDSDEAPSPSVLSAPSPKPSRTKTRCSQSSRPSASFRRPRSRSRSVSIVPATPPPPSLPGSDVELSDDESEGLPARISAADKGKGRCERVVSVEPSSKKQKVVKKEPSRRQPLNNRRVASDAPSQSVSRDPSIRPFPSGLLAEKEVTIGGEESDDEEEDEEPSIPTRHAKDVSLFDRDGKPDAFENVENGSGHRFSANVASWEVPTKAVEILSGEIRDFDIYGWEGCIRGWIRTDDAWYQIDSPRDPSSFVDFYVVGVVSETIVALDSHATWANLKSLLENPTALLAEAQAWISSIGVKTVISIGQVLRNLHLLLPEIQRSLDYHEDWEEDESSPLIDELRKRAASSNILLRQPRRRAQATSLPLPLILEPIAAILGRSFGKLQMAPSSRSTGPRSPEEEEAFVKEVASNLEVEVTWSEPVSTKERIESVEGKVERGERKGQTVTLKVGDFVSIDADEKDSNAFKCSGPLSSMWYAQVKGFKVVGQSYQVQLLWYYHSTSTFNQVHFYGSFGNPRELIRGDVRDWQALGTVRNLITVEQVTRIPEDSTAWFFSRITYLSKSLRFVSSAFLDHPLPQPPLSKPLRAVDLYAGAGGLSTGMLMGSDGRVKVTDAVEVDPDSAASYRANHPDTHVFERFAEDVLASQLQPEETQRLIRGIVDLVFGGPPCQGFSTANTSGLVDDPRRLQVFVFLSLSFNLDPKWILMENVPNLQTFKLKSPHPGESPTSGCGMIELIRRVGAEFGYLFDHEILQSEEYGDPQRRRRLVLVGTKLGDAPPSFPSPTHGPGLLPFVTIRDALGDLDPYGWIEGEDVPSDLNSLVRYATEPLNDHQRLARKDCGSWVSLHVTFVHEPNTVKRVLLIPMRPNANLNCLSKAQQRDLGLPERDEPWHYNNTCRIDADGQFCTITTQMYPNGHHGRVLHYSAPRTITIRERCRAQSIPDWYRLVGNALSICRQIGNAVPIKLAMALGAHLFGGLEFEEVEWEDDEDLVVWI